jgi:hypothetical protein
MAVVAEGVASATEAIVSPVVAVVDASSSSPLQAAPKATTVANAPIVRAAVHH